MNLRLVSLTGALAGIVASSAIAFSHPVAATAQTFPIAQATRAPRGSDKNLRHVHRRLEALIDELQRDQHDYNGHRVNAINDLVAARREIEAALAADAGH